MIIQTFDKKLTRSYENIYRQTDPTRREEQQLIAVALSSIFKNKQVLEIAAGTGYWSQYLSHTAKQITITDIDPEILVYAKQKTYSCPVSFTVEDAYRLSYPKHTFNGGVANFWLSHIPRFDVPVILEEFHRVLKKNSRVFIADNVYKTHMPDLSLLSNIHSSSHKILADKPAPNILKNQYTKTDLINIFKTYDPLFNDGNIFYGDDYWYLYYQI